MDGLWFCKVDDNVNIVFYENMGGLLPTAYNISLDEQSNQNLNVVEVNNDSFKIYFLLVQVIYHG